MKHKYSSRSVFLLVILLLSGLHAPTIFAEKTPSFWLSSLEGKRFDSRKIKDTPFVLSFFFVDCIPCRKEIPQLHKLITTEFPDVPLLFIDPIPDDSRGDIREFADLFNVPQAFFYKDSMGNISSRFFKKAQMAFPTIVGANHKKLLFRYSGLSPKIINKIRNALESSNS